ncbi:MAG: hypothetical protein N3I35_07910 [Clostridia bacterium]|nr:hypothetical protein [Clostridia bacterium]
MKKIFCIICCLLLVLNTIMFEGRMAKADEMLVNQALPLNFQTIPYDFSDINVTGFSTLEYGDLVCSFDLTNRSIEKEYLVPLYVIGIDDKGNLIEVGSTTVTIPKSPAKSISYKGSDNKTCTVKVLDETKISTVKKVKIRLKAGFFIASIQTGIVGNTSETIQLFSYGIRRDDIQNKIIVTGIVKDNYPYPFSSEVKTIKQNAGIVASGYDKNGKIVEVQGASDNVPNGVVKTFELTFLAGSLIDQVNVSVTGNSNSTFLNIYGNRVENGKNIITGNIENNPYSQYVQIVAKGYSGGKVVEVDGKTLTIEKSANASYRFEMDQHNNIDRVEVLVKQQKEIVGSAELVAYSTHTESNKIIVDALVSSGYYKDKNLGIIVSGLDRDFKVIETNTSILPFKGNTIQLQHVKTTLEAGDRIKRVNVELAGILEDQILLRKCAYRVENGTYLVTSIIENGNTVQQTAGVKVTGYDEAGNVVEVTGYSDNIPANSTKQYKSILTNTKDIKKVTAEFVGLVKGDTQEIHASYTDAGYTFVSGIILNGNAQHYGGFIAIGKDKNGKIVDIDSLYRSLDQNTVTPFLLKLNNSKMKSLQTYIVEANKLSPNLVLNGAGFYKELENGHINAVISNGTTLKQIAGIVSIGYDSRGKAVDMNATRPYEISPLTVTKLQNSLSNIKQVVSVKSFLYGVKCNTSILASSYSVDHQRKTDIYSLCITNGAAEQKFKVVYTTYDTKGKKLKDVIQNVQISKYGAKVVTVNINKSNISRALVTVYDSTNKKITGKGISDLVYKG